MHFYFLSVDEPCSGSFVRVSTLAGWSVQHALHCAFPVFIAQGAQFFITAAITPIYISDRAGLEAFFSFEITHLNIFSTASLICHGVEEINY